MLKNVVLTLVVLSILILAFWLSAHKDTVKLYYLDLVNGSSFEIEKTKYAVSPATVIIKKSDLNVIIAYNANFVSNIVIIKKVENLFLAQLNDGSEWILKSDMDCQIYIQKSDSPEPHSRKIMWESKDGNLLATASIDNNIGDHNFVCDIVKAM